MHSHLIHEDAYHSLTRAHDAIRTLFFLLSTCAEHDMDGVVEARGLSAVAEHILNDLRDSVEGCRAINSPQ